MSKLALAGLIAEREEMLELMRGLSDAEWHAPSAEDGMLVRDVIAHIASTHHGVIDKTQLPGAGDPVAVRRNWDVDAVVDEFDRYTKQTSDVFSRMQALSRPMPMGAFGTHPASQLADLYLFDMYGHLRGDLLRPFGPLDREEPPRDEMRVRPTVEWMLAAMPFMGALDQAGDPFVLALAGPGGGEWTIARHGVAPGAGPGAVATAGCTDHEFTLWGTQRRSWREFVKIDGDEQAVAPVLDATRVI